MNTALSLADLLGERTAGPDGYVRLAIDGGTWTALASGLQQGRHELSALWADGGAMRMALIRSLPF